MKRWLTGAMVACVLLGAGAAHADPSDGELFDHGVSQLRDGAYDAAIASFEALADRGVLQADASYDRALAYLARVRAHAEHPGDLGRAAAAFEETLRARPGDSDAEQGLDLVRAEVARRRAHGGGPSQVQARPSLDRAIVGLAPESVWAVSALVSSLLLSAGLLLRKGKRPTMHLAAVIAIPLGCVGLACFGAVAWGARHLRHNTQPAVVVAPEARLLDEHGASINQEPIPEAARVEVLGRDGALARIRYGSVEAWTHRAGLRVLP